MYCGHTRQGITTKTLLYFPFGVNGLKFEHANDVFWELWFVKVFYKEKIRMESMGDGERK